MMYILTTKNSKIILNEAEKDKFLEVYQATKSPLLAIKGQLVDRMGIEIFEAPFYLKQENDRLRLRGLRRCKYCYEIIDMGIKCACSDDKSIRDQGIFAKLNTENLLKSGNEDN